MKKIEDHHEGFRTSLGSNHLESYLNDGYYKENPDVERYGMLLIEDNEEMAFFRTENGIAIDIKKQDKHLILDTTNFGDPISKPIWLCIMRAVAIELDGEFMAGKFIPSYGLQKKAAKYVETYLSHIKHFEV
ncbi:MAG TPA: hypothetical protein VKA31_09430 [Mariprofundaceae bacterium]|nr:hypothetical protein [Mariprofundaceae bacterium]